ncbi:DUF4097 family beta strand repeat-containing protein [Breznakiella homolactica]|uniref:DUF4097 family beta strand repeat protein n=1 Tax=Breznakiella homolactica TaxID=2798577 RepID=A0A7T7XM36_9SPIR|nr:DUF4097 family beta strand repeat-containing protein [Breznakiella homolactica]QQO08816.1 DUF4097 domain-containing protein [Breznakiella homolactica]
MKVKFFSFFLILFAVCVLPLFCGGASEPVLVNTETIDPARAGSVSVVYGADDIELFQGDGEALIVKEYMSKDSPDYYARVNSGTPDITIEQGRRPLGSFRSRIEVTLPRSYTGELRIRSQSGSIRSGAVLGLSTIRLETSSGKIQIDEARAGSLEITSSSGGISAGNLSANTITISSSSGKIRCDTAAGTFRAETQSGSLSFGNLRGAVSLETSSGVVQVDSLEGSFTARSSSGAIRCAVSKPLGNIGMETSSGKIQLSLPETTAFQFNAETSSGAIQTPFSDKLAVPFNDRKSAQGFINGAENSGGTFSVNIKTSSGSITVGWL